MADVSMNDDSSFDGGFEVNIFLGFWEENMKIQRKMDEGLKIAVRRVEDCCR
jgi:hypothetical protein